MYAVIQTGGKQYLLHQGDEVLVEKLDGKANDKVVLNDVLFVENEGNHLVGTPQLTDAKVLCKIVKQDKGPKLTIFKMKRRKNARRKNGHRQKLTRLQVEKIEAKF